MNWETHKKKLLENPEFRKALKEFELEYQVARAVIQKRLDKKLTQAQLAKRLGTRQSAISRLEGMGALPSLSFLRKVAKVLEAELRVELV